MFLNSLASVASYVAATAITVQQPSDNEFKSAVMNACRYESSV